MDTENTSENTKMEGYIRFDIALWRTTGEIRPIGKPIICPTKTVKVPKGKFEITYTAAFFEILGKLGSKKIKVFSYLLDNKNGQNFLNTNLRKIAKGADTSLKTAQETVKILREAGLLKVEGTLYMVSPHLMMKGNQLKEAYLMQKFIEMPSEENQGGEE